MDIPCTFSLAIGDTGMVHIYLLICPFLLIFDTFDCFQPDLSQKFCIPMSFLKADRQGEEKDSNSFPAIVITVIPGH